MLYLFLADGFEETEAIATIDLLRRANLSVCTVSISASKQVKGSHDMLLQADVLFADTNFSDAEMLILPGGMPGTTNLAAHEGLKKLLIESNGQQKPIAAICAAPIVLAQNGILTEKKATCYPGFEEQLGDSYVGGLVVESKNVITAKGMGVVFDFALSIIEKLLGAEAAESVADKAII